MKRLLALFAVAILTIGCDEKKTGPKPPSSTNPPAEAAKVDPKEEAEFAAELAKLSPEDRKLAEEQKFCADETDSRLGSMGEPIKVMVEGEPVFVCCKGCAKAVLKDPKKTLATVKELKEKNKK